MNNDKSINEILEDESKIEIDYSEVNLVEEKSILNNFSLDFLRVETGEGNISDYMDSPLNFNNSKSMARILRGITGFLGNLNLAIVDVFIGVLEYIKDKKEIEKDV